VPPVRPPPQTDWLSVHHTQVCCILCGRFRFFGYQPRDWPGRAAPNDPFPCRAGRQTGSRSIGPSRAPETRPIAGCRARPSVRRSLRYGGRSAGARALSPRSHNPIRDVRLITRPRPRLTGDGSVGRRRNPSRISTDDHRSRSVRPSAGRTDGVALYGRPTDRRVVGSMPAARPPELCLPSRTADNDVEMQIHSLNSPLLPCLRRAYASSTGRGGGRLQSERSGRATAGAGARF